MINRLRRRFIIIAMSSVTLVILLLSLAVNLVNFVSTNADLNDMLELICENRGSIPDFRSRPKRPIPRVILSYAAMSTAS